MVKECPRKGYLWLPGSRTPHTRHTSAVWGLQGFLSCLLVGPGFCWSHCGTTRALHIVTLLLTFGVMAFYGFLHFLSEPSWEQCLFLLSATFKYLKRFYVFFFLIVCSLLRVSPHMSFVPSTVCSSLPSR